MKRRRGRLLFPVNVEIAQLDTKATRDGGHYDDVARETELAPTADGLGTDERLDRATVTLKCQLESKDFFERLNEYFQGNAPETMLRLTFHMADLERAGLMDDEATRATVGNAGTPEPYNLSGGEALTLKIDGGFVQTVTFLVGDFVTPGSATAEEVTAAINAGIAGGQARAITSGTEVELTSDTFGLASKIQVTGGTANSALAFPTAEQTGTGDVAETYGVRAGLKVGDRILGFKDRYGQQMFKIPDPPGLYIREVNPTGFLETQNLAVVTVGDRRRAAI